MKSAQRAVRASIVSVGFWTPCDGKAAPSETKRFFTSHERQNESTTEVFASRPMRAVPTS